LRIGLIGNHGGLVRSVTASGVDIVVHPVDAVDGDGPHGPGVTQVDRFDAFMDLLEHPRLFLLDLPSGAPIDRAIDTAYVTMEPGDVVLDPSASYWGDTLRRFRRMRHRSLYYVDLGLIGRIPGATILAAGDERGVSLCLFLLERLAAPGGVVRAGGAGAAHFALMVRAGVATAVAHAVSEARQLLEAYPNEPEPDAVAARLWPVTEPPAASAAWLLDDAIRLEAAVPLLAQSVMLELGAALDDHRSTEAAPRVGGFVHPDELL
jgi:6-phosphogluconate dehydrogenase (decarboxylating)